MTFELNSVLMRPREVLTYPSISQLRAPVTPTVPFTEGSVPLTFIDTERSVPSLRAASW